MTTSILKTPIAHTAAPASAGLFGRAAKLLYVWQNRVSGRRRLGQLDDRLLIDLGIDRADVIRECGKPFWRA